MTRYIKKTVILAKLETVIGTDAVPTGALNALKVFDVSVDPVDAKEIKTDYITAWLGSSETQLGAIFGKCSFSVSLSGSGDAAVAPAWSPLLLACGFSETTGLTTPARVEWLPATDALKSLTIYYYVDGVLNKLLGCFGNVELSAMVGTVPSLKFEFTGIPEDAVATPNASDVLTAWKPPVPIRPANVVDIKLGVAYAAGALTGGTLYNSTGIKLNTGNKVDADEFCGADEVGISDRDVTGSVSIKVSAAEEVALIGMAKAGTLTTMGFEIGKVTGNRIMLYAPALRFKKPKPGEKSGKVMADMSFKLNPVLGNDELRIVSL